MSEVVAPGDVVGKEEEYLPGENVYVDDYGNLRAQVLGVVIRDNKEHVISVKPLKNSGVLLKLNDVVYGKVVAIPNDKVVVVKILSVENNGNRVPLKSNTTGLIPLSQLPNSRGSISDIVGIGDIIKARVISRGPPYTLTLKDAQLGVVYAICPRCGHALTWKGGELLRCPNCGIVVRRKVSLYEYWV